MTSPNLRSAYGASLVRLGKKDERVVALEADLGKSTQSVMFQAEFPDRYFQMGIAEQNMASTAAGFALSGMIPFIHSFAVFASRKNLRSAAQFHLHSEPARADLRVERRAFRLWRRQDPPGRGGRRPDAGASEHDGALPGGFHRSGEDDGLHAGLAGAGVLPDQPERSSVCVSGRRAVPIGKVTKLRDGKDAAIFASGIMVSKALEAANVLETEGISARVLNISTIKPLDREAVIRYARGVDAIVTAEEHSIIGGIGSAVVEALRGSQSRAGGVCGHS